MQYPFSCLPATYSAIEKTLSTARLARYLPEAKGDKHMALRLYLWNARLCEALYLPMQFAEVAARNAISVPIVRRFGTRWFENRKFENLLPTRQKEALAETVRQESKKRSLTLNQDHIIAGASFGFWVSLMTAAYDKQLWMHGVAMSFPGAGVTDDRESIYLRLEAMRKFRNDIAHHVAIFNRYPQREFLNALYVTKLVCAETHWLSELTENFNRTLSERPLPL